MGGDERRPGDDQRPFAVAHGDDDEERAIRLAGPLISGVASTRAIRLRHEDASVKRRRTEFEWRRTAELG